MQNCWMSSSMEASCSIPSLQFRKLRKRDWRKYWKRWSSHRLLHQTPVEWVLRICAAVKGWKPSSQEQMKTVIKDLTQDLELYLTPAYLIAHVFICQFLFQAGGFFQGLCAASADGARLLLLFSILAMVITWRISSLPCTNSQTDRQLLTTLVAIVIVINIWFFLFALLLLRLVLLSLCFLCLVLALVVLVVLVVVWLNSVSGAAAKVSESDGHLQENPKNSVLTSDKSAGDLCCVLLNSGLRILLRSMAWRGPSCHCWPVKDSSDFRIRQMMDFDKLLEKHQQDSEIRPKLGFLLSQDEAGIF